MRLDVDAVVETSILCRVIAWLDRQLQAFFTVVEDSLIVRMLAWVADAAANSALAKVVFGLGARETAMSDSLVGRSLQAATKAVSKPLQKPVHRAGSSRLARWWADSFVSRLFTYEAGILFVLLFVPVSLGLTQVLPYWIKWAADGVLLLMVAALTLDFLTGRRKLVWTALDGPVFVWITISVISAVVNGSGVVHATAGLRSMFQYYLLALVVSHAGLNRRQVGRIVAAVLGLGAILGAVGVYQWVAKVPTPTRWVDVTEQFIKTRAFGTMANPNTFGGYLVLVAMPAITLWMAPVRKSVRVFLTVSIPLMLAALAFTYSRSAWIALVVALLIVGVARHRQILAIMLAGASLIPLAPSIAGRLAKGFSTAYLYKSAAGGRLDAWIKAVQVAHFNPLFGAGPGQFGGAAANHFGTKANILVNLPPSHSVWVDSQIFQYIAEVGYLGLLGFFWVILTFLRAAKDLYRQADEVVKALTLGFASAVVGMVVMSVFASMWEMRQIASLIWVGMALVVAARRDGLATE